MMGQPQAASVQERAPSRVEHSLIQLSEDWRFQLRGTWPKERSTGDSCRTAKESPASDARAVADKMRVIRRMKKEVCNYEQSQEREYWTHIASIWAGDSIDKMIRLSRRRSNEGPIRCGYHSSVARKKPTKVGVFNDF